MAKPFTPLGEFEMQVLRLVWQHQPCTERQISDLVQAAAVGRADHRLEDHAALGGQGASGPRARRKPRPLSCRAGRKTPGPDPGGPVRRAGLGRLARALAGLLRRFRKTLRKGPQDAAGNRPEDCSDAGARIGRCCHAHHVADSRRLGGRLAEGDGGRPLAVDAAGGAGGAGGLVPAAVLARGPLLAMADRRHQAPADALLVAGRAAALVGTWTSAQPTHNLAAARDPAVRRSSPKPEPVVLPHQSPLPQREGTEPVPQSPTWGELLATISWQAWLMSAWLAVIVWQLLRLLRQRLWLARLLRQAVAPDGELAQLVAELAGSIGLRRPPAILCVGPDCPLFVCGLWRPRLVLPSPLMSSLGPAERRQVILHELATSSGGTWSGDGRRRSHGWFTSFHPLVWWVGYRLRLERELACDQLAMAHSGHPARRLRADPGAGGQPRLAAGGRAGGSHFRRADGE